MGNKIYINGIAGISAQPEGEALLDNHITHHQNIIPARVPNFREYIPAMALRRMSGAVKMGITAARKALEDANITTPDAIITATGQGCKRDTEQFLTSMLDQNEELLTPTAFIQSTHNTVGGQIALNLNCSNYNVTYSQNNASLESALLDAQLFLQEQPGNPTVLVGGVEEISKEITSFMYRDGQLKPEPISSGGLLNSTTPGTITSDGAHFFSLGAAKNKTTYAALQDLLIFNAESKETVVSHLKSFLNQNDLDEMEIDLVLLGNNGDVRYDDYYRALQEGAFKDTPQLAYKHLVGDYDTVSGYAIWLACRIMREDLIPDILKLNSLPVRKVQNILIYNQYLGENHSFILLGRP